MSDIASFITARLDEDEAIAKAANPGPWRRFTDKPHLSPHAIFGGRWPGDMVKLRNVCTIDISWQPAENADHITRHNPARVLADVAAKRKLLELHKISTRPGLTASSPADTSCAVCDEDSEARYWNYGQPGCDTVKLLALPYAEHPDYDPSWRTA